MNSEIPLSIKIIGLSFIVAGLFGILSSVLLLMSFNVTTEFLNGRVIGYISFIGIYLILALIPILYSQLKANITAFYLSIILVLVLHLSGVFAYKEELVNPMFISQNLLVGIIGVFIGIISIFFGKALLNRRKWAGYVGIVFCVLGLSSVPSLLSRPILSLNIIVYTGLLWKLIQHRKAFGI